MAASDQAPQRAQPARRAVKYAILFLSLIAFVVIPFILFGTSLEAWTYGLIDPAHSSPFIAMAGVLLLAADVVLPVPSTVVAAGLGAVLGVIWGIIATAAGLTIGCAIAYWLGSFLGHDFAKRKLGAADFAYLSHLLDRHGLLLLMACRPVPVLAEASVIAAGAIGMPMRPVLLVTALANLGFAAVYAGLGAAAEGFAGFLAAFAASLTIPGIALLAANRARRSFDG